MQNLLNPKWLLLINTLPLSVLFFLYLAQFNLIKTLLKESSLQLWTNFGVSLLIIGGLNLLYVVYLILKKKNISISYAVIALVTYLPFIYLYGYHYDSMIPFSIPQWMVSDVTFLYVGTFLMPTLVYSLFVLVMYFTKKGKEHKAWVNFLMAIGIPILTYVFTQLIIPLWQPSFRYFSMHAILILMIIITIVFFFFLMRGLYILGTKKEATIKKYSLLWKIPIGIVFPFLGLLLNNGHLFDLLGGGKTGIFGDFNAPFFYILAITNGVLLCLPNLDTKK